MVQLVLLPILLFSLLIYTLNDNNIKEKGEFQLTNALENMKNKGTTFKPGQVIEWLDCGNKDATVYTNQRVLEFKKGEKQISDSVKTENSLIIEPCFIGENVTIKNSIVGPHVSIGANTSVEDSIIKNSIIQGDTELKGTNFANSMVGNHVSIKKSAQDLSVGDYNKIKG